jgi:16S rRNA (guanine1207-N2)-methyltransferase
MDTALTLLLQELSSVVAPTLWWMDENTPAEQIPTPKANVQIIANRYDVAKQLTQKGWMCEFADFSHQQTPAVQPKRILARVSKEKALSHFWINQASQILSSNQGELILTGLKQEGIKGYFDRAKKAGADVEIWKSDKETWAARLRFPSAIQLEDKHYDQLQSISVSEQTQLLSKPGIFGWEKVDQGSALLIEHLTSLIEQYAEAPLQSALDIGCGYGYLAVETSKRLNIPVIATDNNAAALIACQANADASNLPITCIAGDCADTVEQQVDLIVCNPPFHTGRGVDSQLTDRFLKSAARCLSPQGLAVFVTNLHIGIEQRAKTHFNGVETAVRSDHFKLIVLTKPK